MLTEFTTERYRSWMGAGYFQFWAVATSLLPLIAYLIPAWRTFLLVTAIAAVPVLGIYWYVFFALVHSLNTLFKKSKFPHMVIAMLSN